ENAKNWRLFRSVYGPIGIGGSTLATRGSSFLFGATLAFPMFFRGTGSRVARVADLGVIEFPDEVRNGEQPSIGYSLSIVGGHAPVLMAHNRIDGHLVEGVTSHRFEVVPERVNPPAFLLY